MKISPNDVTHLRDDLYLYGNAYMMVHNGVGKRIDPRSVSKPDTIEPVIKEVHESQNDIHGSRSR